MEDYRIFQNRSHLDAIAALPEKSGAISFFWVSRQQNQSPILGHCGPPRRQDTRGEAVAPARLPPCPAFDRHWEKTKRGEIQPQPQLAKVSYHWVGRWEQGGRGQASTHTSLSLSQEGRPRLLQLPRVGWGSSDPEGPS